MKAVLMAGGEGTRLRPLTSNQPKPMVPVVGKPCMEHILELLKAHGLEDVVVTVAFLPQAIRSYFGDGDSLGMHIEYSVEESPLGTAGSVRLATGKLDDTFLVISGDALCDVDLTRLIAFHKEREASVTIGLKSVENPLEFGIVVTDSEGRVERFLEKPSWGQVFSDTINTGIYVLEPEVLKHVPTDRPYDFSKELFPLLLEMGRPIYGLPLEGYWQDIGDLDQYRQANFDALDGSVNLSVPGVRLRGNVYAGEGVEFDLDAVEGPAYIGNYCRISPEATVAPYSVLGNSVTLRDGARTSRAVIDSSTHIGTSAIVEGAVIGRNCDLRAHVRIHEGVAIGDEVTIGAEAVIMPGVRIYPYKEVESGAHIHDSLIWESRATSRTFGKDGVAGLVQVDVTPEFAVRLAAALGTALKRGARVVASRESPSACRMIKRAMVSGVNSTGVDVADLRVLPAAVSRHLLKTHGYDAGFHVGTSQSDPEVVQIRFFEQPGIPLTPGLQKEIEKHFTRHELRRVPYADVGNVTYPARVRESYAQDLLSGLDIESVRARAFRIVIDYSHSAASFVLPLVLGPLGVEEVSAHAFTDRGVGGMLSVDEALDQAKRLVRAIGADLGVVFDRAAERLYLVDEQANEIPVEQTLLLFLSLLGSNGRVGKLALPITVTSQADAVLEGSELEVVRTGASLPELTKVAAGDGFVFGGAVGGGYVFPEFLPAYDAVASLCKLLELLAPRRQPLSELVAALPRPALVQRDVPCPWALKGLVMRVLAERAQGREIDTLDGIKVFEERGWTQVLPDPDEPVVHLFAEGATPEESEALLTELQELVEEIMTGQEAAVRS
ncbi:MAG: sugar phosphate nucleotidyltransferase [Actinomycetota bacterium]|nr:sugar phosphate nucleotidyltransferase [Actinomycetota bacterium]